MLDITRLISRAGGVPTGVDRVELAYLRHLPTRPEPLFAIVRTTLGFVLLQGKGLAQISARLSGDVAWGTPDRLSVLAIRKPRAVRQAESDLRRFAHARCRPARLGHMLARHLPRGVAYLNTGHSNLNQRMLWNLRHHVKARIAVLIHDTIPLDFPQFQRPGSPDKFRAMLNRVRAGADLIICNSHHTRASVTRHLQGCGGMVPMVVAHLGVDVPRIGALPQGLTVRPPYFVALGTIEPRKGHDLLLDVWQDMVEESGPDTPQLLIIGRRGWNNKAVFDRLDRLARDGPVQELSDLLDGTVAALLAGSNGLLFPSHAEGFGLPPIEAAALGVTVVCSDLAVIREVLDDIPVYLDATKRYQWKHSIESLVKSRKPGICLKGDGAFIPPTWDDHFNIVLRFT